MNSLTSLSGNSLPGKKVSDEHRAGKRLAIADSLLTEPCSICGGFGYIVPDFPIGHPDFGKAVACQCRQQKIVEQNLRKLQRMGSLDTLRRMTFKTFIPEPAHLSQAQRYNLRRAYDTCSYYAQEPEGWLLLTGTYGCGKTHLAAAIANVRIERGEPALFMLVPDLLDHLRNAFNPSSELSHDELFEQIRNASLLVLDDLGTQSSTPWAQEKLFQLLNHRYNAQLPMVITTNQRLEDLEPRLRSRLLDARLVTHYPIIAPDFRSGKNPLQSELSTLDLHLQQTFQTFFLDREDLRGKDKEKANLKKIQNVCQEYAREPQGWLVLIGRNGSGKTHLAAAVANEHVQNGQNEVMFVSVPNLLDYLRAAFAPQSTVSYDRRFDEIRNVPMLILDDLGTESATPWAREKLFQLLNYRYDALLPTIITATAQVETDDTRLDDIRVKTDAIEPWLQARMLDINRCQLCAILASGYRTSRNQLQRATPERTRRTKS